LSILKKILNKSKNNNKIIFKDDNYLYREFYADTLSIYKKLKKLKVHNKVLVICSNYSKNYLALIFAAYKANYLIVLLNRSSAEKEKLFIIKNSGASLVFSDQILFVKKYKKISNFYVYKFKIKHKPLQKGDRFLIYTSGTTSKPKGVILTDRSITSNIRAISKDLKLKKKDSSIIFSPPNYAMAISQVFTYMYNEMSFVFIPSGLRFPSNIVHVIIKYKINVINLSISALRILKTILYKKKNFLKHVKIVMAGGIQMTSNDLLQYKKIFTNSNIINFYGCTENSPRISHYHINKKKNYTIVPVGRPLKGVKVKINKLKGKYGKILISGTSLMRGYFNIERKKNFIQKRWFNTGDIGYFNKNNEIVLYGREDDTFRVGHEKLAPEEIEPVIKKELDLSELIISKKVNKILNWEPVLVILNKDKYKIDIDKIKTKMNKYLSNYKIPKEICTLYDFPKNSYGKIDRKKIYEEIQKKIKRKKKI
jgi:acyl-CoA synthetase (AMP-forming)/AMP-acid ligase II